MRNETITNAILAISNDKNIILLLVNIILLVVGMFMDMTPAVLIFAPIFLPIMEKLNVHPVHFGMILTFNLSIGLCTPPVGTALFVGCSVSGQPIEPVAKKLFPFFIVLFAFLLVVTYIPELSLFLPRLLGFVQ